jgi:hypothetical protein
MCSPPELPLPSPESAKETSQSFSFSNQGNLTIDLISQTASIYFWGNSWKFKGDAKRMLTDSVNSWSS